MRQVKLAFRTLFRTPFVTGIAVLSLALGIGANAAIYSMFDQILLRSLPVPEPDRLINLTAPGPHPGMQSCGQAGECDEVFSYPMFQDLGRNQTALTGLAAHRSVGVSLAVRGEPMTGEAMLVSGSYFPTLRLQPALGRLLGPSDAEGVGGNYVAVLSNGFWRARLGGDPAVMGQTVSINGHSFTIVGIAPPGFEGTTLGTRPLVFLPLTMAGQVSWFNGFEDRRAYWLYLFGRLKPGVSMEQAGSALNGIYRPILADVEAPLQAGMSAQTLEQFKTRQIGIAPGYRGQSSVHREARIPLLMLFGVTGVVLLIACANIANLLLARGAGRAMEMGVRLALGAARRHLLVQLLTEALLLALMGGAASLLVAGWTLKLLLSLLPSFAAGTMTFSVSLPVVLFTAAVSVVTGLLFGLFPALHCTRPDLMTAIRANAGQISGHRGAARFRAGLVTLQIALATGLLISAGLFLKSLVNVSRVELGVKVDDVVTFGVSPERSGYDSTRASHYYAHVEEELAALPGVTGVTTAMVPLIAGSNWGTNVRVQGFTSGPDVDSHSRYNEVGAGYFHQLSIPVLAGREFTTADRAGGARVAVINQTFARKFNLGANPVGKFMSFGGGDSLNVEIVGLVQDAKYSDVKDEVPPLFFLPWRQDGSVSTLYYYVRSPLPLATMLATVRNRMKEIDPSVPLEDLKSMPQQIRENVFLDRMISILSASFALLATLLAAVGLYGVLAYTVAQRTREIGVRMALGADARLVRMLVVRQVIGMLAIGGALGLMAALGVGRALQSLLYGLKGDDPAVFVLSFLVLGAVAMLAGYVPAVRASRVNPVEALRYE